MHDTSTTCDGGKVNVYVNQTAEDLAKSAANWLRNLIAEHQSQGDRHFTLALAGGSTPKRLYQLLSDAEANSPVDWSRLIILWGDERNVPPDHPDSNQRMALENLKVGLDPRNILLIGDSGGDAGQAADAYERLLRSRLSADAHGLPQIDCILLGMGDDVHTASLFPETEALREPHRWFVANHVPKLNSWRMTLTAPAINAAAHVAFLISGPSKAPALDKLWNGERNSTLYPSQLVKPVAGQLGFFVDRAAIQSVPIPENLRLIT